MKIAILIIVLAIVAVNSYAEEGDIFALENNKDWSSMVLRLPDRVSFRAVTLTHSNEFTIHLTADRFINDCNTSSLTLNIALPKNSNQSFAGNIGLGQFRVDSYQVHDMRYQLVFEEGDGSAYLNIIDWNKGSTLFYEMMRGSVIRFKFGDFGNEAYIRFSLMGFTRAMNRTQQLCHHYVSLSKQNDSSYFNRTPSRRNDADYFN